MKPMRMGVVAQILGIHTSTAKRRWDAGLLSGPRSDGGRGHRSVTVESLESYLRDHGTPEQRERAAAVLDGE